MIKTLIRRPVATAMFYIALLVLGAYSFIHTPLELAPKEDFPQVDVRTSWPGVPPEVIQTQITAPLEEALSTVKGVRKIRSSSQIGSSAITLVFDPKVDMEFVNLALREEIAKTRRRFPYGIRPVVQPYVPDDFRVRPFLSYTITGRTTLQKLRELVKDKLEFALGSVMGVARVDVGGGSDLEIRVTLDKRKLKTYDLQPFQINAALQGRLRTYAAGRVKEGNQEFIFKVADDPASLKDIGETVVASSGLNPIALKDVADIVPSYGDADYIHRINGQSTIRLTISKEKGTNTLNVGREVKKKLEAVKRELPPDLAFKAGDDESAEIEKNLRDLYLLAGIITVIVFGLIFIVLRRFRPALLILSSISFSLVITFNLLYVFKTSLNMLTLGALALGFGMFVDNSIVVFENILRLREEGHSPREAAVRGPKEVFVAVLASTLTTMAAFFTFPYFQGRLKIYYLPLAVVISSALAASLLVSFTLIPSLAPMLMDKRKSLKPAKSRFRRYEKFLNVVLRHPVETVLIVVALLFGSYKWFKSEVSIGEWFRWYSKERLYVRIGMPVGTEIEKTDQAIRRFEAKVLESAYEKEMEVGIYADGADMTISFPPEIENSSGPFVLKEDLIRLAAQFAGVEISVSGFDPRYYASSLDTGTSAGSRIKFFGYNLKRLKEITGEVERTLKRNPRIKDVRIVSSRSGGFRGESFENILKIDKEMLGKYDIDPASLYDYLSTLLRGNFGTPVRIRMGGKEIALSVKFPDAEIMNLRNLQDTLIRTGGGEWLRLREISRLEEKAIAGSIDRENQRFQQTVLWEFRGPSKAGERYRKSIYDSLLLPPGFSAALEEDGRITEQEKGQITNALVFSLILIFMIMAALFESLVRPVIIMVSFPPALIGVFMAFVVAKYPFDASAHIGVILLGGIVVNNAILLVDHIHLKRKQGFVLRDAVMRGTMERIRPIVMTTSTTVFGMLPMLLIKTESGVKRQIWSTLALSSLGGLVTSTIFILIVIPIFYLHSGRAKDWIVARLSEMRAPSGGT